MENGHRHSGIYYFFREGGVVSAKICHSSCLFRFFEVEQQTIDSVLLTEGLADISGLGSTYKDGRGSTYKGCCEHQKT